MPNEVADLMRRAAKMPTPPVQWCDQAAREIDRLQSLLDSEIDARNGCMVQLREKDQKIEGLDQECFKLAAGACSHRGGDDHGNPFCHLFRKSIKD